MTIWWPRGRYFEMMTMVVLVVISWSPYDDHGHHSKMMTTSGVMVIILVECSPERSPERSPHSLWSSSIFFVSAIFWAKFSNAPAQPCRQIHGQLGLLSLLAAVKDKKTSLCLVWQFPPALSWWRFLPITTTLPWYWECFYIRPWGYVHINARCVCAKLCKTCRWSVISLNSWYG